MLLLSTAVLMAVMLAFVGNTQAGEPVDQTAAELLTSAREALATGDHSKALKLASGAIEKDKDNPRGYAFRAAMYATKREFSKAIADYTEVIRCDPDAAEAFDRRGSENFKLGQFEAAIADFDRFIELRPSAEPGHWRRGIAHYYAGEYNNGARQFAGYQTVDDNDVENAVWRYICMARADGVQKARAEMLKIGLDRRVPMMKVYEMFLGTAEPADVLEVARSGNPKPPELKLRMFYAHLYLALFYESEGDEAQARIHIKKAAKDFAVGGYMWEVARVHADWLETMDRKQKAKKKP